jgi:hypothetical protein
MTDTRAAHPDEVLLLAPAGTVVVFNSHLWHGGTLNRSARTRRAMHSYFTRRGNGQQLDQRKYVQPETLARLTPAACFILDVLWALSMGWPLWRTPCVRMPREHVTEVGEPAGVVPCSRLSGLLSSHQDPPSRS